MTIVYTLTSLALSLLLVAAIALCQLSCYVCSRIGSVSEVMSERECRAQMDLRMPDAPRPTGLNCLRNQVIVLNSRLFSIVELQCWFESFGAKNPLH